MIVITERIAQLAKDHFGDMVSIRHKIHMNPELGYQEFHTAQLISEVLESLNIETRTGIAKTGVVGIIRGNRPGKSVLLRADMDALPIQEDVDVPYKSTIENRMHACGHDGHVAGLLGTAMILNDLRDAFCGSVKLVFQPAEETDGGALNMIKEGILDDPQVDAAFGCHLWGTVQEGKVQLCPGPMMAAVDSFKFRIHAKGGHGAYPHLTADPIMLAAQAIVFIQTIVSRRINPLEPVVLTLSSIHGGDAINVIPGAIEVSGTMRTLNATLRDTILMEIESILKGITEAQGATYSLEHKRFYPPLVNDPQMARVMGGAFSKIIGDINVNTNGTPSMASEDFSYFCQAVPSAFAFVGIAKAECEPMVHHQAKFQWDDKNLLLLTEGLAQTALDFLALS